MFSCLLDKGCLFTCGDGSFGQLGHGDLKSQCTPLIVSSFASRHVKKIACGMRHTLALLEGIKNSFDASMWFLFLSMSSFARKRITQLYSINRRVCYGLCISSIRFSTLYI